MNKKPPWDLDESLRIAKEKVEKEKLNKKPNNNSNDDFDERCLSRDYPIEEEI